jgi:hypothetical protein
MTNLLKHDIALIRILQIKKQGFPVNNQRGECMVLIPMTLGVVLYSTCSIAHHHSNM